MSTKQRLFIVSEPVPYDPVTGTELTTLISYIKKLNKERKATLRAALTVVIDELESRQEELTRRQAALGAYQIWLSRQSQPTTTTLNTYTQQVTSVAVEAQQGFPEITRSQNYAALRSADASVRQVFTASLKERSRLQSVQSHDSSLAFFVAKQRAVYQDLLGDLRDRIGYAHALLDNL